MKTTETRSTPHSQIGPSTSVSLLTPIRTGLLALIVALSPILNAQPTKQINIDSQALLNDWTGPHGGVPPFDKVRSELFQPAFEAGTKRLLAEVDAIANQSEPPSFKNTLEALEKTGKALDNLGPLFFTMTSNMNSPEYQKLSGIIRPMLSGVYDQIYFNNKLFARVTAIYQTRQSSGLNAEQIRLVEQNYDSFIRRGAQLSPDQKERMGSINQELAKVFTEFVNNVQGDEDTWIVLAEKDLSGLPKPMIAAYQAAAKKRDTEGYAIVNTRSAVDPFLTFSSNRELREKVWRAFIMRGDNANANNTNELIKKIVKSRADRAKLLGYPSHAHWRMSDTMAKDPAKAVALLKRVWPAAVGRVKEEVADMQALADSEKAGITIEPWDYRYYMEKVRQARYDLDQTEFKKYFELNNMIRASYYMAERLYGYIFTEITGDVPTFQKDVRVFRVNNKADDSYVGLLYRDDFARQYKRSGAWQSTYQTQNKLDGQTDAIVSNNNNFVKGAEDSPVLISLDDAETLFHEFGHAIHGLANDTTYPGLAGTPRDFVEFPSQVHENWVLTREVLDQFARHYQTGEKMPQQLIDKMKKAETFNQGFATVEYMASAFIDMQLHMDGNGEIEPSAFEREALEAIGMPKEIVLRHRLPHFLHLFSSDAYSAGYYSYLWSDVMAADAWQAFEETGNVWDPGVAKKFFDIILATGDAIDRAEAYRQFRGRDPQVEALLKNRGFPTGN
jgi:peptidyl-dipeptidase Dcp